MNWEAIGTLAEVVGAIAVVVSLLYVAIQIRQNTRQVEGQARGQRFVVLGALGEHWRGFRSNIISNPEAAGVWRRGNENPGLLTDDESTLFDMLMLDLFWGFAYNWMMGVEDGLGDYLRDEIAENLLIYDSRGLRDWWATSPYRNEYPSDFANFVDRLLGED